VNKNHANDLSEWVRLTPGDDSPYPTPAYYRRNDGGTNLIPHIIQAGCNEIALSDDELRALIRAAFPAPTHDWDGERVTEMRESRGLSQYAVERLTEIPRNTWREWELGKRAYRGISKFALNCVERFGLLDKPDKIAP
jgi:DNA-binding transcriptional regulator YiaG